METTHNVDWDMGDAAITFVSFNPPSCAVGRRMTNGKTYSEIWFRANLQGRVVQTGYNGVYETMDAPVYEAGFMYMYRAVKDALRNTPSHSSLQTFLADLREERP